MSQNQTPVVEARELKQTYTVRRGMLQKPAMLQAVGGVSFSLAGRPDPSSGRRIGMWQIHPGACDRTDRAAKLG